jgi:hypothetical protein
MALSRLLYAIGVACAALAGFFYPLWFLGFVPLSCGAIWAAYDLVDVKEPDDQSSLAPPR